MSLWTVLLIGIGVSADAFAVSLARGLKIRQLHVSQALLIGGAFGVFQALMPIVGWLLGTAFSGLIQAFDHWVAFGLLALVGLKMLWEAVFSHEEADDGAPVPEGMDGIGLHELLVLAVATSVDALAVGLSLALLDVNIWFTAAVIGIITFVLSTAAVFIGHRVGVRYQRPAEIIGGVILIGIGISIVVEHLSA
jgi:putative Mn2+ efflux pump MntP